MQGSRHGERAKDARVEAGPLSHSPSVGVKYSGVAPTAVVENVQTACTPLARLGCGTLKAHVVSIPRRRHSWFMRLLSSKRQDLLGAALAGEAEDHRVLVRGEQAFDVLERAFQKRNKCSSGLCRRPMLSVHNQRCWRELEPLALRRRIYECRV